MRKGNGEIPDYNDEFYSPWERGVRQGGLCNIPVMAQNFKDFKEIMNKHCVKVIPIFGTLLGFARHGEIIETTKDSDFACFSQDHYLMHLVIKELKEKGFYVLDRNESPLGDHHIIRGGEKIEIWWFQEFQQYYVYDRRMYYPKHFFDELITMTGANLVWWVPKEYDKFLKMTYIDWRRDNIHGSQILNQQRSL